MMTQKFPGLRSILALAAMLAVPAQAALITGVTIENVSSQLGAPTFNRLAVFAVNGAGFQPNGPGTHSSAPDGTMWLSHGTFRATTDPIGVFPRSYIEFDLGANYNLDRFNVWNYNEGIPNLTNRGANLVNISVASAVAGPFTSLGNFNFTQAPGNATTSFGQLINLSSFSAARNVRLVRFDVLSNHGDGNQFVGLSEVRFFTPEPSVVTLVGLGGLMMFRRRRRS